MFCPLGAFAVFHQVVYSGVHGFQSVIRRVNRSNVIPLLRETRVIGRVVRYDGGYSTGGNKTFCGCLNKGSELSRSILTHVRGK